MRNRLSVIIVVVACVVLGFLAIPQEAQITVPIFVGNTSETVVAGACLPPAQGGNPANCSLRGAILQANAGSSNSIIRFEIPASNPSCTAGLCTINLTSALPAITEPLSIVGSGADKLVVRPAVGVNVRVLTIDTPGTVSITGLTISNGFSDNGGGVGNFGSGTVNVTSCAISDNSASVGGGVYHETGIMNVINSTINDNSAPIGSGLYNGNATLNVINSTISGNSFGGGIHNTGTASVTNSTITANLAPGGGGIRNFGPTFFVKSTIVAHNGGNATSQDVSGDFVSAGFNLIRMRDGSNGFTIVTTDQTGTIAAPLNPRLDPAGLQDNGGPTKTIALLHRSPAIDKGTSQGLHGPLTTDQRGAGYARAKNHPFLPNPGDGTDIGAFERNPSTPSDFDDDGQTDIGIFRPSVGEWWIYRSSTDVTFATQFGQSTDRITPGDYTADGKDDIAFWRPSNGFWFILRSQNFTFFSFPFGTTGDVPVSIDIEGDDEQDEAVFRPSNATWFIVRSFDGGSVMIEQFGESTDIPVPGDYDGDGAGDLAIFRPSLGQWWIKRSSAGVMAVTFGNSADKPVPGDYTGDGRCDIAFWRPSTGEWFVLRSEDFSFFSFTFGANGDIPAPGDYDGDGRIDATVFRPSSATWFSNRSTAGTLIQQFGVNSDRPIPSAFVP